MDRSIGARPSACRQVGSPEVLCFVRFPSSSPASLPLCCPTISFDTLRYFLRFLCDSSAILGGILRYCAEHLPLPWRSRRLVRVPARHLRFKPDRTLFQEVTDSELLALAGPSQGDLDPALHLSSVVADSARRWLAATDDTDSSDVSSIEDDTNNSSNHEARLDEEAIIM